MFHRLRQDAKEDWPRAHTEREEARGPSARCGLLRGLSAIALGTAGIVEGLQAPQILDTGFSERAANYRTGGCGAGYHYDL